MNTSNLEDLFDIFSSNEFITNLLNELADILECTDENKHEDKKEVEKEIKEEVEEVTEDKKEFVRPSSKLTTNQGLQLHQLVQEYIDTMIKPYANGIMDTKTLNDAYVGLYEFAAWILLK